MLLTSEFSKASLAAKPDLSAPTRGNAGNTVFPFQGVIPTGLFAPPFVYDFIARDRGTAWKALDLRANLIAGMEWHAYKLNAKGERVEMPPEYWAEKIINNPASPLDDRTGFEIRKLIFKWGIIAGNAYSLAVCQGPDGADGVPESLWPMEPNNITTIAVTKEFPITQFRYTTPRGVYTYPYWRVWHFRRSEPTPSFQWNLLYGIPEFSKYGDVIDTETQALLSQSADLANNSMPNFVLKQDPTPGLLGSPDIAQQEAKINLFRRQWLEERTGAANAGKMAVLPVGWEAQVLSKGDRESPFDKTIQSLRKYIATMQGTPLTMMDGEYNARATAEVVSEYFFKNQVLPDAILMRESLNKFLLRFEENLIVDFVNPITMPFDERRLAVDTMAKVPGAMNGNKAGRLLLGNEWEDTAEGEEYFAPSGTVTLESVVNPPEPPQPAAPVNAEPPPPKPKKKDDDAARTKAWMRKEKLAQSGAKKSAAKLKPVWDSLVESITAKLPNEKSYHKKDAGEKVKHALDFDVDEWAAKMWAATKGVDYAACKQAVEDALSEIDADISPDWSDDVIEEVLDSLVDRITTEPLTTFKSDLEDLFKQKMSEGADVGEVTEAIKAKVDGVPEWKAKQVAQSTVPAATNMAQLKAWKEAGVKRKEWLSTRGANVRDQHAEMDGQIVGIDENFRYPSAGKCKATKSQAPGHSGQACSDINEHCYMRAVQ